MCTTDQISSELLDALRDLFNITSPSIFDVLHRADHHYEAAALANVERAYDQYAASLKRTVSPELQPGLPFRCLR